MPRLTPSAGEHGGWGLRIVDRIAARWGIEGAGNLVWFELPAPTTPAVPGDQPDRAPTPLG